MAESSFEYPAVFWIPDNKEKTNPGKIQFQEGGTISFEILGELKALNYMRYDINTHAAFPFINGITNSGRKFTLIGSRLNHMQDSDPGFIFQTFYAEYLLMDVHIGSEDELLFIKCKVRFQLIDEWVGYNNKSIETKFDAQGLSLSYQKPQTIELFKNEKYSLEIVFSNTLTAEIGNFSRMAVKSYIEIKYTNDSTLFAILETIKSIRYFFSLASAQWVGSEYILVQKKNSDNYVEVLKQGANLHNTNSLRYPYFYFNYEGIKNRSQEIFEKWFKIDAISSYSNELFFDTREKYLTLPNSVKFINWMQSIEALHRNLYSEEQHYATTKKSEADLKILDEIINVTTNKQHIEFLEKTKNRKIREIIMQDRFKKILNRNNAQVFNAIFKEHDVLISKLIDKRTELIHDKRDSKNTNSIIENKDLYKYNNRLIFVYQIMLMQLLGFSEPDILKSIKGYCPNHSYFDIRN